ncbi:hypothetical protein FQ087_19415 [Sporosarcina sp. ANT_H38]|uniref:hypothetical protein n=1 Tax=Sporosarcina sp. ANT_H38 TaxID=2597358 RepID=UPI0011F1FBD8|nr:hypothetical protein [Sporosarcina sp. ANT_H38]KAA0944282.1 hypothetical protein FQ087_19415 [Sporosarcina sp. ANT_H38]
MKQKSIYSKVAQDMFFIKLKWSLWFLSFILLAYIVLIVISVNLGNTFGDFSAFSYGSSRIYMLVIGTLSAYYFLPFYIHQGLTRKDYFIGTALSSFGISIAIAVFASILTGIEYVTLKLFSLSHVLNSSMENSLIENANKNISIDLTGMMFGGSKFIDVGSNLAVTLLTYSISIFIFYLIGWLIGVGYYRFGWIVGFGFILISLLFIACTEFLLGSELGEPLTTLLPFAPTTIPVFATIVGMFVLIVFILWIIRLITRSITIKMF